MKWSELPQEYRDLEIPEKAKNDNYNLESNDLFNKFNWFKSNEGPLFWEKCYLARSIQDLPPIPKPKMTEQFREAGEKSGENYVQYEDSVIMGLYHKLKEAKEYIEMQDDQIINLRNELKEANCYIESQKIDIENLENEIDKLKKELKDDREYIAQQSQQIEQAAIIIGNLKNELSETIVSDAFGNSFVEKTRKIMEPAFYMVFVDGMVFSPTEKHKTLEDAITEANRLSTNNESVVHVLAHVESYQRKITITIEQVK